MSVEQQSDKWPGDDTVCISDTADDNSIAYCVYGVFVHATTRNHKWCKGSHHTDEIIKCGCHCGKTRSDARFRARLIDFYYAELFRFGMQFYVVYIYKEKWSKVSRSNGCADAALQFWKRGFIFRKNYALKISVTLNLLQMFWFLFWLCFLHLRGNYNLFFSIGKHTKCTNVLFFVVRFISDEPKAIRCVNSMQCYGFSSRKSNCIFPKWNFF